MNKIQISDDESRGQPGPTLLTVAQVAKALQTTQKMVRHWLASGELEMAPHPNGRGRAITARSTQALQARMQAALHKQTRRENRPKLADEGLSAELDQIPDSRILFTVLGSCQPLIEVLSDIHDFRMSRGRRYDLASILTLACVAMLCGCRTHTNIALWGRYYGSDMLYGLGFSKARIPCSLTLCMIFNGLNRAEFEEKLTHWANSIIAHLPFHDESEDYPTTSFESGDILMSNLVDATSPELEQLATIQDEVPGLQVLAPLGRQLGLPPRRAILSYGKNELTVINAIIGGLVLEGQVVAVKLPAKSSVKGYY